MEKIDYETARKKYDEGFDCIGRMNENGKKAVAEFAANFYKGLAYDLNEVCARVEMSSSRLVLPCASPLMEFVREEGDKKVWESFRLLPAYFDWFVR